jgi:hypothetical protein
MMDQRWIYSDAPIQPQITAMEARQQEFNSHVNIPIPSKVGYLHYVYDGGPHDVHGPWLGDDLRFCPHYLGQILMWGEHAIVLAISQFEVTDVQHHNMSQWQSNCMYLLWEVRSDQGVVEVPRDIVMTNHTS